MSNEVFNFEEFLNTVNHMALVTKTNGEQLGTIATEVKEQRKRIGIVEAEFSAFKEEQEIKWKKQKERERIDGSERQQIANTLHNRINDIFTERDFSEEERKEYYGSFAKKAWWDGKHYSYVAGNGGVDTKQMYLNDVIEYYGTWIPHGYGVEGYIKHLDIGSGRKVV